MPDTLQTPPMPATATAPRRKHGCCFYGCITAVILFLLFFLGAFFAVRYALHRARVFVADYTDTAPMPLPKSDLSESDLKQLNERITAFQTAVAAHTNTAPLILAGPEINALLARSPELQQFNDHFRVHFEGDNVKFLVSLPLDDFPKVPPFSWLDLKGRYFNGTGTFKVSIEHGKLAVYVASMEAHGKPVPFQVIKAFRDMNLADGFNDGSSNAPFAEYESAHVKDGTLTIEPKKN